MKAVSQNYRGLGNQPAVRGLLDLQKAEDPDILFLSETKLLEKEMERFRWMLNMPNLIVVDCVGRRGGLALFSRKGLEVNLRWKGRYHIDVDVVGELGNKWRFTGIYGESKASQKDKTWRLIRTLSGQSDLPWLCMGDFNEVLFSHEKEGGRLGPQGVWILLGMLWRMQIFLILALLVMLLPGGIIGILQMGIYGKDSIELLQMWVGDVCFRFIKLLMGILDIQIIGRLLQS
jgi:hypothetical protein